MMTGILSAIAGREMHEQADGVRREGEASKILGVTAELCKLMRRRSGTQVRRSTPRSGRGRRYHVRRRRPPRPRRRQKRRAAAVFLRDNQKLQEESRPPSIGKKQLKRIPTRRWV